MRKVSIVFKDGDDVKAFEATLDQDPGFEAAAFVADVVQYVTSKYPVRWEPIDPDKLR